MEENKPTIDLYIQPHHIPLGNAIRLPTGAEFDLKPNILQLLTTRLQFRSLPSKNPLEHLSKFTSLCEGLNGGNTSEITMMSFFLILCEIGPRDSSCNFLLVPLLHGTS